MSLERYLRDEGGFRKYVELMEEMPTAKRKTFMDAARTENALFVTEAEKYILTFDRITKLPEGELCEVFGGPGVTNSLLATAIASVPDAGVREHLLKHVPRRAVALVSQELKEFPEPKPFDVAASRLQLIKLTRELEKAGKLESIAIPRFRKEHFAGVKKAA
jgi:flagellar motor switch protein FliG